MKIALWFLSFALLASCSPNREEDDKFAPSPAGKGSDKEASRNEAMQPSRK